MVTYSCSCTPGNRIRVTQSSVRGLHCTNCNEKITVSEQPVDKGNTK